MKGDFELRSIRVRLTRAGALYIGLTLAMGVVAVNSGNNLLYLSVAGLLALLSLSGILAYANLRGLGTAVHAREEIYAGRPVTIDMDIRNMKRRLPSYLLTVEGSEGTEIITEVRPGESARVPVRMRFVKRGRQPLGRQRIGSAFPFGLIIRGGSFDTGASCLVFPQPLPVPWDLVERAERQGEDSSLPASGTGGDYRGVRDYFPGDPLSRIHWKGWLRHRRLLTKEFEAEGAVPVFLSYAAVPGPGPEERLGQLTWLVRTALRRGRAVGLSLPGRILQPGTGSAHRAKLLTALALFGDGDELP